MESKWPTMPKSVRTVGHYLANPISLLGLIVLTLATAPAWNFAVEGASANEAWQQFVMIAGQFTSSPIVRLLVWGVALYLLVQGARSTITADRKRTEEIENQREQVISEAARRLRSELEPAFKIARHHVLLERKDQLRRLEEETNTFLRSCEESVKAIHKPFSSSEVNQLHIAIQYARHRINDLRVERGVTELWEQPRLPSIGIGPDEMIDPNQHAPWVHAWDQIFAQIVDEVNAFREFVRQEIATVEAERP